MSHFTGRRLSTLPPAASSLHRLMRLGAAAQVQLGPHEPSPRARKSQRQRCRSTIISADSAAGTAPPCDTSPTATRSHRRQSISAIRMLATTDGRTPAPSAPVDPRRRRSTAPRRSPARPRSAPHAHRKTRTHLMTPARDSHRKGPARPRKDPHAVIAHPHAQSNSPARTRALCTARPRQTKGDAPDLCHTLSHTRGAEARKYSE